MKILKVLFILFLMLFIIFGLTGCNIEENTEEPNVYFTPICFPTSNGGIQLVMIPKI